MKQDQVTCGKSTIAASGKQLPRNGIGFLQLVLDSVDDSRLVKVLQGGKRTGRHGFAVRAMFRAYLAKFVLNIRYNNQLLERLRGSEKLREVCGFGDEVPSESTMSRFVTKLADHLDLIEEILTGGADELRRLVPTTRRGSSVPRMAHDMAKSSKDLDGSRDTLNKNGEGFSGSCRRSFAEVPRLSEPISRMFRPPSWLRRGRCGL